MLAPVILFVYNRPWHTQQALNALMQNKLAPESILYIFADGPKEGIDSEMLNKINETRRIIKSLQWCREIIIYEQDFNGGLANSIINGVTQIINKYGKVIVVEDDLITSPFFLNYMNDSLDLFSENKMVGSINAYLDSKVNKSKLLPYFLLNGGDCWGWATWKDRWINFISDASKVKEMLVEENKMDIFNYGGMIEILDAQIKGEVNSWHIRWHGTQILNNQFGLFPNKSFVENIGLDGSGTHGDNSNLTRERKNKNLNQYQLPVTKMELENLIADQQKNEMIFRNAYAGKISKQMNYFQKDPKYFLKKTKGFLKKHFLPINENEIFTHLTKEEKELLYQLSQNLKSNSIAVEIGSYLGASSVFIAKGLKNESKLFCIDTWGNHAMKYEEADSDANERDTFKEFKRNTKRFKSTITMLRGWSYDMIGPLKESVSRIDLLFIDGDHNYDGVKKDWDYYSPLLVKGSVVVFHDTGWAQGVQKIINDEVKKMSELIHSMPNLEVYKVIR